MGYDPTIYQAWRKPLRSRRDPALEKANTILKSEAAPEVAAAL